MTGCSYTKEEEEMAKSKMMLNNEWGIMFQSMPDESAGKLIKALFACHEGKDVSVSDPMLSAIFSMMSSIVIENDEKYEERCRKNAENRSKTIVNDCEGTSTNDNDRGEIKKNKRKENKDIKEKDIEKESPAKTEPCMVASKEIIDYLNQRTGSKYRPYSEATVKMIKGRLSEGHTIDDFKHVIDVKAEEWMGTEQEKFLRPETLFRPAHFESYLNQKPASKKVQKMPDRSHPVQKSTKFFNFPQRDDDESKDLVQQLIRQQTVGGAG